MALLRAGDGWAWGAASEPGVNGVNQSRQLVVGSQKGASPCQATWQGPRCGTWLWPKGSDPWRCVLGTQLVQTPPQNIGKGRILDSFTAGAWSFRLPQDGSREGMR